MTIALFTKFNFTIGSAALDARWLLLGSEKN